MLQLENEAYNGNAFWLRNMREQWAFVHDLQLQEVRDKNKAEQLAQDTCAQVKSYCQDLAIQSVTAKYCM